MVPEPSAIYPLTDFDGMSDQTSFITGWLFAGVIDPVPFAAALRRVTEKWRMLAGRLESVEYERGKRTKWQIRIPLGPLPPGYATFNFAVSSSHVPVTDFISLPPAPVSGQLPTCWFSSNSDPITSAQWASSEGPMTSWKITHLPIGEDGQAHTCVGLAFSHGLLDGVGVSCIVYALEAELQGREWDVPSLPRPGFNANEFETALTAAGKDHCTTSETPRFAYWGYAPISRWGLVKIVSWYLWDSWWGQAEDCALILPKEALTKLINDACKRSTSERSDLQLSAGDVLVAWLLKAIYSEGMSPQTIVHCSNVASVRSLLPFKTPTSVLKPSILTYPHNAFVPLPYPLMAVSSIRETPLHNLAQIHALARRDLSTHHVLRAAQVLRTPRSGPIHPGAAETLTISNVSSMRTIAVDFSTTPGEKAQTLYGYRALRTAINLPFSNMIFIAGRLADGNLVVNAILSRVKMENVKRAVNDLIAS